METSEAVEGGMKFFLLLTLLLNFLGRRESKVYMLLVRVLTIVLHLPIYSVVLTSNLLSQIEITISIVLFDLLENYWDWQWIGLEFPDREIDLLS